MQSTKTMRLARCGLFAAGGGLQYVLRPSFGYLLGFIVAAYVVGKIAQKAGKASFKSYFPAALSGAVVLFPAGYSGRPVFVGAWPAYDSPPAACGKEDAVWKSGS